MSLELDADRGRLAEDVLANPVYQESYALIEQALIAKWRGADRPEVREELHKILGLLDKVQGLIESTMRSGKVASKELERKRSVADRLLRR